MRTEKARVYYVKYVYIVISSNTQKSDTYVFINLFGTNYTFKGGCILLEDFFFIQCLKTLLDIIPTRINLQIQVVRPFCNSALENSSHLFSLCKFSYCIRCMCTIGQGWMDVVLPLDLKEHFIQHSGLFKKESQKMLETIIILNYLVSISAQDFQRR